MGAVLEGEEMGGRKGGKAGVKAKGETTQGGDESVMFVVCYKGRRERCNDYLQENTLDRE